MENTLQVGDRVMVNKVVYHLRDIKRGDIVVFDGLDSWTPEVTTTQPTNPVAKAASWFAGLIGFAPPSEKDFIKRVIGVPGDHVTCCDAKGRVSVNGVAARRDRLPVPGQQAVRAAVRHHGPGRPAVGHGRPPRDVVRLPSHTWATRAAGRSRRTG